MKKVIDQYILDSLREYLNHQILHQLEAFTTKTNENFYSYDPKIQGKTAYGSSYGQLVFDSSIPNAVVPSSIGGYNRGDGGMSIDFMNGRALFNSPVSPVPLRETISVNDISVYTTTKSEQRLIFEEKLDAVTLGKHLPPKSLVAPAVFIRNNTSNNLTYCFGGTDDHVFRFKIVCLVHTMQQLQGIQYVIRESRHVHIPLIEFSLFTPLGDIRNPFNYLEIAQNTPRKLMIRDTSFANTTDEFEGVNKNKYVGIGNMELRIVF